MQGTEFNLTAHLSPEWYLEAIRAHGEGRLVTVRGDVQVTGGRSLLLESVREFRVGSIAL
jgi:hypothetical protein